MKTIKNLADGWLSPTDLEDQYGISTATQSHMRMQKRQKDDLNPLPFSKIGKRILYRREPIEAWLLKKAV